MPDNSSKNAETLAKKQQTKRVRCEIGDDDLADGTNDEVKQMFLALSAKLDTLNNTMSGNDIRLNAKIDNLEATVSSQLKEVKDDVYKRMETVSHDLNIQLENVVVDMKSKCESNASGAVEFMTKRVDEMKAYHESRLDKLERLSLDKDIIISGVPTENNDDPFAVAGDICRALNSSLEQGDFVAVYRLKNNRSNSKTNRSTPIVARLRDDWAKRELLTAYFRKKNLNLSDIGFKSPTRIFINERLTAMNREIFNRAAEAKKANSIQRFFTRRGLVFIQRDDSSRPTCIYHISDLNVLFLPNHDRPRNAGHPCNGRVPVQSASLTPTPLAVVHQHATKSLVGPTNLNEPTHLHSPINEQQSSSGDTGKDPPVASL